MSAVSNGRPLEEWSWNELLTFNQMSILMAIPKGEFNQAVHIAMELTTRWKALRDR